MDDNNLRTIAVELNLAIVNVEYRLVPLLLIQNAFMMSVSLPDSPQIIPFRHLLRIHIPRLNGYVVQLRVDCVHS